MVKIRNDDGCTNSGKLDPRDIKSKWVRKGVDILCGYLLDRRDRGPQKKSGASVFHAGIEVSDRSRSTKFSRPQFSFRSRS